MYEEMFEAIDELKARMFEDENNISLYQSLLRLWEAMYEFLYVN
jgi:hypothetical protein